MREPRRQGDVGSSALVEDSSAKALGQEAPGVERPGQRGLNMAGGGDVRRVGAVSTEKGASTEGPQQMGEGNGRTASMLPTAWPPFWVGN